MHLTHFEFAFLEWIFKPISINPIEDVISCLTCLPRFFLSLSLSSSLALHLFLCTSSSAYLSLSASTSLPLTVYLFCCLSTSASLPLPLLFIVSLFFLVCFPTFLATGTSSRLVYKQKKAKNKMKSFFNSFTLNRCELKFNFGVNLNLLVVLAVFF